jgi:hypothetical protein
LVNSVVEIEARLKDAMTPGSRGIIDSVDKLLRFAQDHPIAMDEHETTIRIRLLDIELREPFQFSFKRRVFRVILARIAAICNDLRPGSVSPYGGSGDLAVPGNPSRLLHADFSNTLGNTWLKLKSLGASS